MNVWITSSAPGEEAYGKTDEKGGKEREHSGGKYDISFRHVSFGYEEGKDVLRDISFTVPEGSTFGILGGTGSGKSTVIQLLSRLYELEENRGSICIGGRAVKDIPIEELRRNIGMVLQEPF